MAFEAARTLGERGYRVALTDVDGERAAGAAESLRADGIDATGSGVDSRRRGELERFAADVVGDQDLDVLVSAVGGSAETPRWIEEIEPEHVSAVLQVCVASALNATEVFRPALMRAGGGVLFVSSSAARIGDRVGWSPVYAMGKGAVLGLVRYMACAPEWYGVRTTALCPGDVLTERTLEIFAGDGWSKAEQDVILHRRNSLGRIATPAEVGAAIAALVTNPFASGTILDLVGGEYATPA
jgi:NAD(P)-dependent dehydrogenase (short-subunit alcohol dehydrogenase family)